MTTSQASWPQAAADLARRATRHERLSAAVLPLALGVIGAAIVLLAAKAFRSDAVAAAALLPLAAGGVSAALAAVRVRPARASDAAWALDRLGGAAGRGIVAATVPGAAGAEAAWAAPRVVPPAVRVKPPRGLGLLAGALLLATVALVTPGRRDLPPTDEVAPESGGAISGPGGGEARARERAVRAREAERVREALGLTPEEAADPAAVRDRMSRGEAARAAGEAATGTGLARAVAGGAAGADDLAAALAEGHASGDEARRLRREAATARAAEGAAPVPASRRALLERYAAAGGQPR